MALEMKLSWAQVSERVYVFEDETRVQAQRKVVRLKRAKILNGMGGL